MQADIRDEWRLRDIERKADEANRRCDQLHEISRDVDRLEYSLRDARAEIDGLRDRCESLEESIQQLTLRLEQLEADRDQKL